MMIVNGVITQIMDQDPDPVLEYVLQNESFLNLIYFYLKFLLSRIWENVYFKEFLCLSGILHSESFRYYKVKGKSDKHIKFNQL